MPNCNKERRASSWEHENTVFLRITRRWTTFSRVCCCLSPNITMSAMGRGAGGRGPSAWDFELKTPAGGPSGPSPCISKTEYFEHQIRWFLVLSLLFLATLYSLFILLLLLAVYSSSKLVIQNGKHRGYSSFSGPYRTRMTNGFERCHLVECG